MDQDISLTAFDQLTQSREIQMMKTMIPYMKNSQKKQFAILIKYMELQNTAKLFAKENQLISMCALPEEENNTIAMLNELRKFCTQKEAETIDTLTNILTVLDTYDSYFSALGGN